jgi:hypothetical protein
MRDAYTIAKNRGVALSKVFNGKRHGESTDHPKEKYIKRPETQIRTIKALGLGKINRTVKLS